MQAVSARSGTEMPSARFEPDAERQTGYRYSPMCHIVAQRAIMCYAFSRSLRRLPISLRKPDAATPLGSAHLRLPPRRPLAAERLSDLLNQSLKL